MSINSALRVSAPFITAVVWHPLGVIGFNLYQQPCHSRLSIVFEIHRNERWSLVLIRRITESFAFNR
jgi:hypothetical protein